MVRQCSAYLCGSMDGPLPRKNQWELRARVGRQRQWAIQSEEKVRMVETKRACTREAQKDRKDMKAVMKWKALED